MTPAQDELQRKNQWASDWMHQGIDLLPESSAEALERAVRCFDQAIALRRAFPLAENPFLRYGLSAGWVNRGDALARLERKGARAEAIQSYDTALALLQSLPLEENPLYPRRLAIAWINRGIALQKAPSASGADAAAVCFRSALAVLAHPSAAAVADTLSLQAGAWLNLAGTLPPAEALLAAQKALALAEPSEQIEPSLAEAAFKARHLLCRLVIRDIADKKPLSPQLRSEAAQAAETALRSARYWKHQPRLDVEAMTAMIREIFRFGCRLHGEGTPGNLDRFLRAAFDAEESSSALPLDSETFAAAQAAIWSLLGHLQSGGFPAAGTPDFESFLSAIQELKRTEKRLEARLGITP